MKILKLLQTKISILITKATVEYFEEIFAQRSRICQKIILNKKYTILFQSTFFLAFSHLLFMKFCHTFWVEMALQI